MNVHCMPDFAIGVFTGAVFGVLAALGFFIAVGACFSRHRRRRKVSVLVSVGPITDLPNKGGAS